LVLAQVEAVTADLCALGVAALGILGAGEARFNLTCRRASVSVEQVAIIALLSRNNFLVSTNWVALRNAKFNAPWAAESELEGAVL
jgi:hypothetical protein